MRQQTTPWCGRFSPKCICCRTSLAPLIAPTSADCASLKPKRPSSTPRSPVNKSSCAMRSFRATQRSTSCTTLEKRLPRDGESGVGCPPDSDGEVWRTLAGDLKRRFDTAQTHRERIEGQLAETRSALAAARSARVEAEQCEQELRQELEAIEASLAAAGEAGVAGGEATHGVGLTLLYVGGRQAQIGHLRAHAERSGAVFLHHDGGVEERGGLLPGLVSRADAVLFPVDCVS